MRFRLVVGLVAIGFMQPNVANAQANWTPPVIVYQTDGYVTSPTLIADPSGDVHLFAPSTAPGQSPASSASEALTPGLPSAGVNAGSTSVLVYSKLHAGRWSNPIDILASPAGGAFAQPEIVLDAHGYVHVVWKGPANDLYYSQAYLPNAASAQAWTAPRVLVAQHLAPGPFGLPEALAISASGDLHLVYATDDGALYYCHSADGGTTWSSPRIVLQRLNSGPAADLPRLIADDRGQLQLTWTELSFPSAWPPTGAYYSRSDDGGSTWSSPVRVAADDYGLITLAARGNTVVRVWNGTVSSTGDRRDQWSADGGQIWSTPELFTQLKGGFTGFSGMGFDSLGVLHLVTSLNGQTTTEAVYHFTWNGTRWGEPEFISMGAVGARSVEAPTLAIGLGNRLHVAYEDDFKRIWYTSSTLDIPQLPPRALPPPRVTDAPRAAQVAPTATVVSLATPSPLSAAAPNSNDGDPPNPILVSAALALVLVTSIAAVRVWRRR